MCLFSGAVGYRHLHSLLRERLPTEEQDMSAKLSLTQQLRHSMLLIWMHDLELSELSDSLIQGRGLSLLIKKNLEVLLSRGYPDTTEGQATDSVCLRATGWWSSSSTAWIQRCGKFRSAPRGTQGKNAQLGSHSIPGSFGVGAELSGAQMRKTPTSWEGPELSLWCAVWTCRPQQRHLGSYTHTALCFVLLSCLPSCLQFPAAPALQKDLFKPLWAGRGAGSSQPSAAPAWQGADKVEAECLPLAQHL
nr:uncharacterized protein LOC101787944 [Cavia porcellus]